MDTMYPQVNENVDVERYIYLAIVPTAKSLAGNFANVDEFGNQHSWQMF